MDSLLNVAGTIFKGISGGASSLVSGLIGNSGSLFNTSILKNIDVAKGIAGGANALLQSNSADKARANQLQIAQMGIDSRRGLLNQKIAATSVNNVADGRQLGNLVQQQRIANKQQVNQAVL